MSGIKKTITAKKIDRIVKTGAYHVLYREDGRWYMNLKHFPGALFDKNGYILFNDEKSYLNNKNLKHGERLNIRSGIEHLQGYRKFTDLQKKQVLEL